MDYFYIIITLLTVKKNKYHPNARSDLDNSACALVSPKNKLKQLLIDSPYVEKLGWIVPNATWAQALNATVCMPNTITK